MQSKPKYGRIGTVSDFLFDDTTWLIRWLVVDTGKWLPGRKVLLPPSVLGHLDQKSESFAVRLAMNEVKDSANVDADRPMSRKMESHLYNYYGWNPYWSPAFLMGGNVDRETVKRGPAYDPAKFIDRDYVRRFHSYYRGIQPSHPR